MTERPEGPADPRRWLLERSVADEALRARLLAEPRATVEAELGVSLPADVDVRVVEETSDVVYLVLPAQQPLSPEGSQMTDRELEVVAGGGWTSGGGTNADDTCIDNPMCD